MPIHDLYCPKCDAEEHDVLVRIKDGELDMPLHCDVAMRWRPPQTRTDVLGSEHYDPINEIAYTSTRDREAQMRAEGWSPAGDKVHGARGEDYLNTGKIFSFAGQTRRS